MAKLVAVYPSRNDRRGKYGGRGAAAPQEFFSPPDGPSLPPLALISNYLYFNKTFMYRDAQ